MSTLPFGDDRVAVEARIAAELLRLTRPRLSHGQVIPPPPYVRRHAVEHAAAGNALDDRFLSAEFLPYVDAPRLRVLNIAVSHLGPGAAAVGLADVWRKVAHAWNWEDPAANESALEFWAAAYGAPFSVQARTDGVWRTRWVHWGVGAGEILGRETGVVFAVAAAVLADGTPVAVAGYEHPGAGLTVRAWGLADGSPLGDPLAGPPRIGVSTVGILPDGTLIVVNADFDQVRAWDLAAGTWIGHPLTDPPGSVARVAAATSPDGTPIAVTSGFNNVLQAWDLAAGTKIGHPVIVPGGARPGPPEVAAATQPDGTVIAVTGSPDGTVRAWDLAAGSPIGGPLTASPGAVATWPNVLRVAVAVRSDGTLIAVSGGCDDTVQAWDLAGGARIGGPLTGAPGAVDRVAVAVRRDGAPFAVTGGRGGMVRTWDLAVGAANGDPLMSAPSDMAEVAVAVRPDGTPIAVTGGRGGLVRAWNLAGGSPIGQPVTVPQSLIEGSLAVAVTFLPSGTLTAVTASPDGTVCVWDLDTGTPVGQPLTLSSVHWENAPNDGVAAVAAAVLPDGTPIAVTGSSEDRLRLWNLASRTPIDDLATGLPIRNPWVGYISNQIPVALSIRRDGAPIAVTRNYDNTMLRAWDLAAGTPIGDPLTDHEGEVAAVAAVVLPGGTPIAITGGYDGTVRAWDLAAGTPICPPLTGHAGAVAAVAAVVLPGGTLIAVTGGYDAAVRTWNVAAGREVGHPLHVIGPVDAIGVLTTGGVVTAILVGGGIGCIDLPGAQW